MNKTQFQIDLLDEPTSLTLYQPELSKKTPLVIVIPGLKGYANWGSFPYICEQICKSGMAALCIDFSCNGVENFESEITRIDLAEKDSVSRQVKESQLLIKSILDQNNSNWSNIDTSSIFVLGHSLGGAVALLLSENNDSLKGVITWSSISKLNLWPDEVMRNWEKEGRFNMPNQRTGQDFYIGKDFFEDVIKFGATGIIESVKRSHKPLLIVHGDADSSVPVAQAREIFSARNKDIEICIIPNGDHNFGAVHPFNGTTNELEEAISKTTGWIKQQ